MKTQSTTAPTRRSVLAASAWSVPAIALISTATAAAASDMTLRFGRTSYSGTGCSDLSGIVVSAQTSGGVVEGTAVSISLPSGFAFPDGSSTVTRTTDASGRAAFPNISTPNKGGRVTLTATSAGTVATALADVAARAGTGFSARETQAVASTFSSVPADATPVGAGYFLSRDQRLFYLNDLVASNVASAAGWYYFPGSNPRAFCDYVTSSGGGGRASGASNDFVWSRIPAGSVAVGADYFLSADGRLFFANDAVASGVSSAAGWTYFDGATVKSFGDYVLSSGGAGRITNGAKPDALSWPGVPADALAVNVDYFLRPNGDLLCGSTPVASGVSSARGSFAFASGTMTQFVGFVSGTGAGRANGTAVQTSAAWSSVPTNAVAVGGDYFLAPNGSLYFQNALLNTGVDDARGWVSYTASSATRVCDYVIPAPC